MRAVTHGWGGMYSFLQALAEDNVMERRPVLWEKRGSNVENHRKYFPDRHSESGMIMVDWRSPKPSELECREKEEVRRKK